MRHNPFFGKIKVGKNKKIINVFDTSFPYTQGLRINFFIWASQRGLGDDASKRRNAYAGDSSNR